MEITDAVKSIIAINTDTNPESIHDHYHLVNDLNADSLTLVCITLAFETFFNIDISIEDTYRITTVQDAITYIKEVLAN